MTTRSLLNDNDPVRRVDRRSDDEKLIGGVVATDDAELIRAWAQQHDAEPATGEATDSGPATVDVHDGGAGIRFNFPAASRFRPISWDEWLRNFRQYDLLFVYERDASGNSPSGRYRLVPKSTLEAGASTTGN